MDNKPNIKSIYVRAVPRAQTAIKRVKAELAALEDGITQEAIVTASWLWMEKMDPEELHQKLSPHLKLIREALDAAKVENAAEKQKGITVRPTGRLKRGKPRSSGA